MSVELPEEIRDTIKGFPHGFWSLTSQGLTAFVLKTGSHEIHSLWKAPIQIDFKSCPDQDTVGAYLCLKVLKPDGSWLGFEHVWDISKSNQRRDVERLATQKYFDLYFFDSETNYAFTRRIRLTAEQRTRMKSSIGEGLSYLDNIEQRARNLAKIRAHFTIDEEMD